MRARRAALDALGAVREREAYANLVLPGLLRRRGLTGDDAARATDLTYGTLRGLGTYDRVIEACSSRALTRIDARLLDVLRVGMHQLFAGRMPRHAAVWTTVELARQVSGTGPSRFVNAVLRQAAERDLDGWVAALAGPHADLWEVLALRQMHPRWVVDAFAAALDGDERRVEAVLAADNEPARVSLAAIPGRCEVEELVTAGADAGRWASTAAVSPPGDPSRLVPVRQGRARVQDEGSQLMAIAVAAADVDGAGEHRWLDMCAGPGGKAVLLAALGEQHGARLLASEVHPHRCRLVRQALSQAELSDTAAVVNADSTLPAWRSAQFSRVLLDAPCTGLGALRRRPEARWRRSPDDLTRLVPLQTRLLHRACDSAAAGGVVGYVTCSPHRAETVEVVEAVVAARDDVTVEHAPDLLPTVPDTGAGPYVQLWPDRHGTDAMFLALLRRTSRVG